MVVPGLLDARHTQAPWRHAACRHDEQHVGGTWSATWRFIGGGISLTTQRASESAAAKRHAETLREARRPERLTHLVAFLKIAQEAERVAKYIHHDGRTDLRERA